MQHEPIVPKRNHLLTTQVYQNCDMRRDRSLRTGPWKKSTVVGVHCVFGSSRFGPARHFFCRSTPPHPPTNHIPECCCYLYQLSFCYGYCYSYPYFSSTTPLLLVPVPVPVPVLVLATGSGRACLLDGEASYPHPTSHRCWQLPRSEAHG